MSVNYDVWGAPETWQGLDGAIFDSYGEFKKPKSGAESYYKNFNTGTLPIPAFPTDRSLAFWGIGEGSIINKPVYLAPYWEGDNIKTAVRKVNEQATVTPCIFNYAVTAESQFRVTWHERYNPNVAGQENIAINNLFGAAAFSKTQVTSFNYQKILLVPYVRIAYTTPDASSWHFYNVPLKEYIDGRATTYANYGKIVAIGYKIALGDGINNNRSIGHDELGITIPVSVGGSTATYQPAGSSTIYKWYATESGFDTLFTTNAVSDVHFIAPYYEWSSVNYSSLHTIGDATTGINYVYCKNYYAGGNVYGQVPLYFFDTDSDIWTVNDIWNDNYPTWAHPFPYIEVTTDNLDEVRAYVLQQIAYIGLPFVYDAALAVRGQIGDTGIYLPVFSENGITTGEYEEGRAALRLPNSEWIDGRTGSGYDPDAPSGEGDLDNVTGRNLNFWSSSKYYLMRQDDLDEFLARVNGLYTGGETAEEKAEELRKMQVEFKGSNPSDYIVGLYGLPFQWVWPREFFQPVMLGPVEVLPNGPDDDTAVELINPDADTNFLLGEIEIPELGNFLDFEPYTTLMLYVPYCGTVQLSAAEYIGHSVRIEGKLDKQTGELAVRIMRDGLTVTNTMTGNLYIRIPITAQSMGTYETNLHQLQMAAFNREFGLLTNAVTGGVSMGAAAAGGEGEGGGSGGMISPTAPISMAASLIQLPIAMADYDFRITHCQPPVFYSSSASSANQAKFYQKAKLFIKRPVFLDSYNTDTGRYIYAHTVGHACCIQVEHLGDMASAEHNHLIKCSNVDLTGIPATSDELAAIKKALTQGVYI